jgi:hypothetical protein
LNWSPRFLHEIGEAGFSIVHSRHCFEIEAEPCDGNCYIRLDADKDHLGTAPAHFRSQVAQGTGSKGVHHVEGAHIEDDAAGMGAGDLVEKGVVKAGEVFIDQGGLDGGNQVGTVLQDGNFHARTPRKALREQLGANDEIPAGGGMWQMRIRRRSDRGSERFR